MLLMLRWLLLGLLISLVIVSVSAYDNELNCCDEDGYWSVHTILECQKVSDFFIAVAYFSIPLELLYFISKSNLPFKWVLVQFIAFIVLCGLTHLLNGWTYNPHPSFQLIMSLTVAKILTALVSCATAITLLTLIPLLLKIKVRELFLAQNVLELDQEVGMMKKQTEASMHVRMLTQEIRKSLDKHTILYTTLVELSKTLKLQNCAVWMPNESRSQMNLTHELSPSSAVGSHRSLPVNDPDVLEITKNKGVRILRQDSVLAVSSSGGSDEPCAVAATRMPLLRASDFKGGTPELVDTRYAILVLVLSSADGRVWSYNEMEIVEVVADQVAVALSHAAVLEESQTMREKLEMRNRVLQQAKENALKASQARTSFQKVMNNGMRRPMHSILGLLSIFQDDKSSSDQKIIVDTMVKTSTVLSTLINDAMEISAKDDGRFPVEMRPFQLHSLIREASCLVKCLSVYKGFGFSTDVPTSLPNQVMGDEKRTFQVLLHMVGHLLNISIGKGFVILRVVLETGTEGGNDKVWVTRRPSATDEYVTIKFEIEVSLEGSPSDSSISTTHFGGRRHNSKEVTEGLSFSMCKKLVKERRYLLKEFPELSSCRESSTVLEVGCGNGSTALPILRGNKSISLYVCDCSKEALERAKENIEAANIILAKERFHQFHCDFSANGFPNWLVCTGCRETFLQKQNMCSSDARILDPSISAKKGSCTRGVDFVTLIFTLSAVPLHRMSKAIAECFFVLKPGGLLLFRDYGLYDMTMLRFEPEQRVGYREYMRSDGTRSYFFCLDSVRGLFCGTGFTELELEYCCVQSVNRRNGKIMRRVWIHGKFQKPHCRVGS